MEHTKCIICFEEIAAGEEAHMECLLHGSLHHAVCLQEWGRGCTLRCDPPLVPMELPIQDNNGIEVVTIDDAILQVIVDREPFLVEVDGEYVNFYQLAEHQPLPQDGAIIIDDDGHDE